MVKEELQPPIEQPDYSEDELLFRSMIIEEMNDARNQREQQYAELDDMTYKEYWESNAKAAGGYIPPKQNEYDVRTTSGTTREKTTSVLTAVLNYNLSPDVEAYDEQDKEIQELGTIMEDMIKKSRKIEEPDYDTKRPVIYKELFDQGTVVVEDVNVEFSLPDKVAKNFRVDKLSEMDWSEKMDKVYKYCTTNIISGLNVYFGNIREFYIELQPFMVIRQLIPRSQAQSLYGTWERWKNVPHQLTKISEGEADYIPYNNWTMESIEKNKVEIIKYYNKWSNNFMIMINGVMMFPVKRNKKGQLSTFPLSSLNGRCEYPLSKGDIDPISRFFAYSRSFPAKTKVDQALYDEMLKAIVLKTRKSYQPPMANNTGKTLSKRIFYPGTIHGDINPEKLQEIGRNDGVTSSEFNTIQFVKQIIDEKTVSPVFEGQSQKGSQTAREISTMQQQSMQKLGLIIIGVMNFEKSLSYLRLYNILKYWTEPVDEKIEMLKEGLEKKTNVYRSITMKAEFPEGQRGNRVVEFTEDELPTSEQIDAEDQLLSKLNNTQFRKHYINPKLLRSMDYKWYIEITPTEKNTSELKVAMFEEMVQKMIAIFAPLGKMPNLDFIAKRWSILQGEDPDMLFPPEQQAQIPQQNPMQQGGAPQELQGQLTPNQPSRPSVNSMAQ